MCGSSIRFGSVVIRCDKRSAHKVHRVYLMTDDDKRAFLEWRDTVGFESAITTARLTAERAVRNPGEHR